MKKLLSVFAGVAAIATVYLTVGETPTPQAADHSETGTITATPLGDINDFYAWTTDSDEDGTYDDALVMAMTIKTNAAPGDKLSDAYEYNFHVNVGTTDYTVTCTYDATGDTVTCALVGGSTNESVTADWDTPKTDGAFSVYAGVREDSFYFNGYGFTNTVDYVVTNAAGLVFTNGCPNLAGGPGATIRDCLLASQCAAAGAADQDPANAFADQNVIGLVVEIPAALIPGGTTLKAWASTVDPA
jgi:hypothetical protein